MKKNQPLHYVRPINDLREMLRDSIEEYSDRPAFLIKPEIGKPYAPVTFAKYRNYQHHIIPYYEIVGISVC